MTWAIRLHENRPWLSGTVNWRKMLDWGCWEKGKLIRLVPAVLIPALIWNAIPVIYNSSRFRQLVGGNLL